MSATAVVEIRARRVYDSRGRPTVEAEVGLQGGARGRAIAPAGASRGSREAVDLRDGGAAHGGLDVAGALTNVRTTLAAAILGADARDQPAIDAALIGADGTPNKARLGGNAIVAVALAVAQAAAGAAGVPLWRYLAAGNPVTLPLPEIQIFGGGAHAGRRLDLQDVMVMPVGAASFADALTICADIYRAAGASMAARGRSAGVADEGGWWPDFASNEEALEAVVAAIEDAGYVPGRDAAISLDIAASELLHEGRYRFALDRRELDRDELTALWLDWLDRYPIASIEDPLAEDDEAGWRAFARAAGKRVQIVGDDYLTTSAARAAAAARAGTCNAVLLKPNQAGTLTETRAALDAARVAGMRTIVSARSGETEDVAIAHLAVGWNAGQLKVGAFARGERMAKWNEVLRIEEALGADARFAGRIFA
ncbi:MAG: phosphopyruvate hydratase [Betaproteobacteria bacterium]